MKLFSIPRARGALALVALTLVVLASYWKLTTMKGVLITDDIFASDIMNDGFPYRFYLGEVLKAGELPLWYPPVYGGFPLLARAEAGICYPPNLVLFGLLPPVPALNCVILATILTAGIGMYLFAREIGAGIHGSLLAGFAYAYSGFMVSHLKHLSMVNSACWFPLGLFALERALREDRAGPARMRDNARALLWFGGVFAMQNLSGHIQIAYYSAIVYGAYFLLRLLQRSQRRKKPGEQARFFLRDGLAGWFVAAGVAASMISAVQILPTYELVQHSQRAGGVTFEYASQYPYDPTSFWTFFYPPANGEPGSGTYSGKGIFWEDYGYVGILTLVFAAVALLSRRRSWHVKFLALAAFLAYLLVLGVNTPFFKAAFTLVPMMNFFRFPTRMIFVVDAALAAMGAIGLTRVQTMIAGKGGGSSSRHGSAIATIVVLASVADLLFFQIRQNAIAGASLWMAPPRTAVTLQSEARSFRIYTEGGALTHIAAFNAARGWLGSLQPFVDQREFLQPSLNVLYGFSTPNGYAQLTPAYVVDLWGDQNRPGAWTPLCRMQNGHFEIRPPYKKLLSLHNVRTILSPLPLSGETFVPRGPVGQVLLYENPDALPRAFVVGSYRIAADDQHSLRMLLSDSFNPSHEVILTVNPGIAQRDSLAAISEIESYRTNEVVVRVTSAASAILVLSDTYYPGWEAEIDGAQAEVLRANFTMRAVVVPAGTHNVRFVFRPKSVERGFIIAMVGLAGLALMMVVPGRNRQ